MALITPSWGRSAEPGSGCVKDLADGVVPVPGQCAVGEDQGPDEADHQDYPTHQHERRKHPGCERLLRDAGVEIGRPLGSDILPKIPKGFDNHAQGHGDGAKHDPEPEKLEGGHPCGDDVVFP